MTKEAIEKLIEQQEKISHRNYMNYQESGIQRYMRAHERAEDLISICRMAASVADIKSENLHIKANFADCVVKANYLLHNNRWLEGENIGEVRQLLRNLSAFTQSLGVNNPWEDVR